MRRLFIRTLAVTAIIQFVVTRTLARQAVEEGRAERMWLLFPLNVLLNAAAWTLMLAAAGRVVRVFRHVT